jgi:23S rRNA (uracil1939-C5)-methyltransferase
MNKRRRRLKLKIDSLAAGGDGVGRDEEGRVTFVAQAVPGDLAVVELLQDRKQFARGKIVELLEASSQRVEPRCSLFSAGSCGGCQWQQVAAESQKEAKEEIVDNGLRRAIGRGMTREALEQPCPPYGWRRRARMSFWSGGEKRFIGFYPPKSKQITDVPTCPQLDGKLQDALAIVRKHLLPALRHRGEVELLLGEDGAVHVAVHGTVAPKGLKDLAAEPMIAGVRNGKTLYGSATVELEGGIAASADGFAQASRAGNLALCDKVTSLVGDVAGKDILELYAGSGNFTRLFAGAKRVVAVESAKLEAVPDGVDWREAEVVETLEALGKAKESFDLVVLDPPRSGAKDAIAGIAALEPKTVVYVSCDVATLSRDVEALCELGYTAESAHPVDLMPQTSHVEVVLVLRRTADSLTVPLP